jgi:hypothetical protein
MLVPPARSLQFTDREKIKIFRSRGPRYRKALITAKHANFAKNLSALAESSFGRGDELAELVKVLLVLVHLLVRDPIDGQDTCLRFVSKAEWSPRLTVPPGTGLYPANIVLLNRPR